MKSSSWIKIVVSLLLLVGIFYLSGKAILYCPSRSMEERAELHLSSLKEAVIVFEAENGVYPLELNELIGPVVSKIPLDPWGRQYQYHYDKNFKVVFTLHGEKTKELIYEIF